LTNWSGQLDKTIAISGIFFLVHFLRRTSRKRGTLCPTARFYRSQIQSCQGKVRLEIFRTGFGREISGHAPSFPAEARGLAGTAWRRNRTAVVAPPFDWSRRGARVPGNDRGGTWGTLKAFSGIFFFVHFLRRTSRKIWSKCPMCLQEKNDGSRKKLVIQIRATRQPDGHFRDLFSCTFLTKDFPENRVKVPGVPGFYSGRSRTCGDHIPAHLPAMNPDKALASGWEEGGWLRAGGGAPGPEVTCTPFNPLLRRRAPTGQRSGLPKISLIPEKPTLLFCEIRNTLSVWLDSA